MADTVTSDVTYNTDDVYGLHLTGVSDGTGETNVIKVDKSAMTIKGQSPAVAVGHMAIERVRGFQNGYTYIKLHWDHTTDDTAVLLGSGQFDLDFREHPLHDPQSTGGTGDLLLSTVGHTAGDVYDIHLDMRFYK